jgi:HK97 family phage prohead protease
VPDAERAQMTAKSINDLPDSDFAYIEPGGTKDADGKTVPRSLRHFPIHDAEHVRNALARAPQSPFGDKAMPKIRAAAKKYGIDAGGDTSGDTARSVPLLAYARSWALDDIHILRAAEGHGDGRTVEAYAAVFDTPAEIRDQHGHYNEVIHRSAFNRTLSHGIDRVGYFYNHAMTMHGTPAEGAGSVPIGSPVDIRADGRGLRTVTRLNRSDLADHVLEAIRNGDLKAYSFRGRIFRSDPSRTPRRTSGRLPTVTRTELGLTEYGPTPNPAYRDAGILAVRSELADLRHEVATLTRTITSSTLDGPDEPYATPDPGLGAEDPRAAHSSRQKELLRLKAALRDRGL